MNKSSYADRIKYAMDLRGIKQSELVKKTGLTKGAISSYINNRYKPKQDAIYLISKALNVSEIWLMGLTNNIDPLPQNKKESSQTETIKYEITVKLEKLELNELIMINSIIDSYMTNKKE